MDSITEWKEKERQKNRRSGAIFGAILGLAGCVLSTLFWAMVGDGTPVETDEEREERLAKEAEAHKEVQKQREERNARIRDLQKQKIELERELNELNGRQVVGYVYNDSTTIK